MTDIKVVSQEHADLIGLGPNEVVGEFEGPQQMAGLDGAIGVTDGGFGGAMEGASRFNRELALWHAPIQHPDSEIMPDKQVADGRGRSIRRNDAYVQSGIRLRQDSIVGEMFFLNAKPNLVVLGLDEKFEEAFQEEVEAKFTLWAESPQNWVDAARINTLTNMVRLGVGIRAVGGEILATAEWLRDGGDFRPYNSAVQMVDPDRLSTPMGKMENKFLRGGVEKNMYGAPQAYHIRLSHPSDTRSTDHMRWKRVPARKPWPWLRPQVLHIYEQYRPDQTRGVADIIAALKEMKITKKFRDVTLQNAVVNATYAATIESELPDMAYAALGAGHPSQKTILNYAGAFLNAVGAWAGASNNMHLDGVRVPHLFPGTKFNLQPAGTPGGVGTEFEQSLLRYIAANLGVSYEQLAKDFSKTNYSGFKGALNETEKAMRAEKRRAADGFANFVYRLWLEEAINKGEISAMPSGRPLGWWYEGLNMEALLQCSWIGAGIGQVDELKETQAAILRLKHNLSTHEEEIARRGGDYRKTFAQKEREKKDMEERDILPPDADEAINAASGSPSDGGDSPRGPGDQTNE